MASTWTSFQSPIELDKVSGSETYHPFIKGGALGEFWLTNRAADGTQRYIRRATSVSKDGTRNENLILQQINVDTGVVKSTQVSLTIRGKDDTLDADDVADLLTELKNALGVSGFITALANNEY